MNAELFKSSNAAGLGEEQIRALPTHRLKAYRKKLLKVITQATIDRDGLEDLRTLYPSDDWSGVEAMENVLKIVNQEYARRSSRG